MPTDAAKTPAWTPTKVQFLYKRLNNPYYVRTFAGGKEKWTSLKTSLLSVAKKLDDGSEAVAGPDENLRPL